MMGREGKVQERLFSYNVNLSKRVRKGHPLRRVAELIDFDFIYDEVGDTYGRNGNVSVPPPVILKMMFLLVFYNVRSERELMDTIPERLDWLWFLGYTLDDEVPNHSVLSKARARWGVDVFRSFFERIVYQCVEVGLVDGGKLFVDASLIDANASNKSVVDRDSLDREYSRLEGCLEDLGISKETPMNGRYISTTDPDADIVKHGGGGSRLRYKTHRGVDGKSEVITATRVTPGSVDDGKMLSEMVRLHEGNTQRKVGVVVADSKYGTVNNFFLLNDLGVKAHIRSLEETQRGTGSRRGIFPRDVFRYDAETDTFICPAGHRIKRHHYDKVRRQYVYRASKEVCDGCEMRARCTRSREGRILKRYLRQGDLDRMYEATRSREARRDIKKRQDLSERSFAWSTRYGYKRARWRRLWRMEIQDFLIAAVQNISILIRHMIGKKTECKAQGRQKNISIARNNPFCYGYFSFLTRYSLFTRYPGLTPTPSPT